MTARELIERLADVDPAAIVLFDDDEYQKPPYVKDIYPEIRAVIAGEDKDARPCIWLCEGEG